MSDVQVLLACCRGLGATFTAGPDGKLKVKAPAPLPEELRKELRRRKREILTLLLTEEVAESSPAPRQEAPSPRPAQKLPEDFPLVDLWLTEHHPTLWRKVRELDSELTRLEQGGVPEKAYQVKQAELLDLYRQAKSLRSGSWGALLIRSAVLGGEEVWVVQNEEEARAVMGDGRAIYYADEMELLKTKTPEQIRDIHKAKLVFPGSRVVQG